MSKRKNKPLFATGTYNRWGQLIDKGSVVKEGTSKGIVVKLLPLDNFSRAYGRQALVRFVHGKRGAAFDREIGINDLSVIGRAKRVPRVGEVTVPPNADEIKHHETIRDIRRQAQGPSYNPEASYNVMYERPLPGRSETRVVRNRRKRS